MLLTVNDNSCVSLLEVEQQALNCYRGIVNLCGGVGFSDFIRNLAAIAVYAVAYAVDEFSLHSVYIDGGEIFDIVVEQNFTAIVLIQVVHEIVSAAGGPEVNIVLYSIGVNGIYKIIQGAVAADKCDLVFGCKAVEKLRELGLLKIDNGASIVDLEEYGMPPCLILKKDGSTLYPTRDIAAAVYRKQTYDFDKCIYVTAASQSLHFSQWFKVVEMMGYDWYTGLVHVPYGTVSVGGAKLATRAGNVVLLRDLFKLSSDKVKEIMGDKNPDLENRDEVAEAVGVGAIIFNYLYNSRIKDINFTLDQALSFEGSTGPYAQYTYARTCSILSKAADAGINGVGGKITHASEEELLKTLSRFPEKVEDALAEYEPSVITRYVIEVCTAFNHFYRDCPIVTAETDDEKEFRVRLTRAANNVLGTALHLICMRTPEKI